MTVIETAAPAADTAPATRRTRAKRPILIGLLALLLMMLSFGAWALASPVGGSPDEDFHLASIWCGSGEREGLCAPGNKPETRMVPDNIERAICYAHRPTVSAACQGAGFMDGAFGLTESDRVNGDGLYPSGYYFWTSLLAGDNMVVSTLAIRFSQALLFSVLTIGLWTLLPRTNRLAYVGGIVATFVPFGMFLIPSLNPSGWAISSAALLLPSLVGYLSTSGWRSWALGGYAILAALLGLGARGDAAAYTVVAALAALVLAFDRSRQYYARAILPLALIVGAAIAFLSANQTGSALSGGMALNGAAEIPKRALVVLNLIDLPELLFGILGQNFHGSPYSGLGWLDTPLPAAVWLSTTAVLGGILFTAVARCDWRKSIALAGVGLALVAIPMLLLVQNSVLVGWQVQPRYVMPLLIMFVMVALFPSRERGLSGTLTPRQLRQPRFSLTQAVAVAVLLSIANAVALYINLRRYVSPVDHDLIGSTDWWWRVGPPPMVVWGVGSLSFVLLAVLLLRIAAAQRRQVNDRAEQRAADQAEHDTSFEARG